eukprot:4028981-Prymnesium_polylepis.1
MHPATTNTNSFPTTLPVVMLVFFLMSTMKLFEDAQARAATQRQTTAQRHAGGQRCRGAAATPLAVEPRAAARRGGGAIVPPIFVAELSPRR